MIFFVARVLESSDFLRKNLDIFCSDSESASSCLADWVCMHFLDDGKEEF